MIGRGAHTDIHSRKDTVSQESATISWHPKFLADKTSQITELAFPSPFELQPEHSIFLFLVYSIFVTVSPTNTFHLNIFPCQFVLFVLGGQSMTWSMSLPPPCHELFNAPAIGVMFIFWIISPIVLNILWFSCLQFWSKAPIYCKFSRMHFSLRVHLMTHSVPCL